MPFPNLAYKPTLRVCSSSLTSLISSSRADTSEATFSVDAERRDCTSSRGRLKNESPILNLIYAHVWCQQLS